MDYEMYYNIMMQIYQVSYIGCYEWKEWVKY